MSTTSTMRASILTLGLLASLLARTPEGRQASTSSTTGRTPGRTPIDVSKLGPQVGERVPDFSLKDQNGKTWTLESIAGPKGAMLVFFRSADW
jgi:hypothetical protein